MVRSGYLGGTGTSRKSLLWGWMARGAVRIYNADFGDGGQDTPAISGEISFNNAAEMNAFHYADTLIITSASQPPQEVALQDRAALVESGQVRDNPRGRRDSGSNPRHFAARTGCRAGQAVQLFGGFPDAGVLARKARPRRRFLRLGRRRAGWSIMPDISRLTGRTTSCSWRRSGHTRRHNGTSC